MSAISVYKEILKEHWGYDNFRGIQADIILSITSGKDTLGLMPTGGGKSITFQVPALSMEGTCIVITPLIALMKDQVSHLRSKGISAYAIYTGMSRQETLSALDNCILGNVKLLYISPERISSEQFQNKLKRIKVSFITIDEAHCISQWGYDFRPSYLDIAQIRALKPQAKVLALTATATPEVVKDIQNKLQFAQENVYKMSFERSNLSYIVRQTADKEKEMVHILSSITGSAIVYVRSRKHAKDVAEMLEDNGISATFYHAGLELLTKDTRQTEWQEDKKRVMVATNAFGMGIDKPNVRLVIHLDCPNSIEAYFQEAGRAGRDKQKAYAVLLYNKADEQKLQKRISDTFPPKDYIIKVYEHLAFFFQVAADSGLGRTFAFDIDKFCRTFKHFPVHVNSALFILMRAGYILYNVDPHANSRVKFLLERHQLDTLNHLSPQEDAVVTALLRLYGNLFIDYGYIDEALIAQKSQLNRQQVYQSLKGLTNIHVLHYIPQKQVPQVSYTQNRMETSRIRLSPKVYEERKEVFVAQINAMISYAKHADLCRSRMLLRYFGEEHSQDCKQCDVCIERTKHEKALKNLPMAMEQTKNFLKNKNKVLIDSVYALNLPEELCKEALRTLINEEEVEIDSGFISLK